jgi:hypothetical protein
MASSRISPVVTAPLPPEPVLAIEILLCCAMYSDYHGTASLIKVKLLCCVSRDYPYRHAKAILVIAKGINEMNALEEEKILGVFCRLKLLM